MTTKIALSVVAAGVGLLLAVPVWAHHAFGAEFDVNKPLKLRGSVGRTVEFYSWVWASGSHGGPRLFHPTPGSSHVIFLRQDGGYLHTVGDYPSYDLELRSRWLPALLSAWNSGEATGTDPLERLVALRFRAEFEGLSESQLREDFGDRGPIVNHYWATDLGDLVRIVGPFFVVAQLDDLCRHSTNPSARFAVCFVTGEYFPGRCEAYQLACFARSNRKRFFTKDMLSCV